MHRENIPRGILEPGDPAGWSVAIDSLLVLIEAVVTLEGHALRRELVDRCLHVADREVEDRVVRRCEVGLRIDEDLTVAELELKQRLVGADVEVRDFQPECLSVELLRVLRVIDRVSGLGVACVEHGVSSICLGSPYVDPGTAGNSSPV